MSLMREPAQKASFLWAQSRTRTVNGNKKRPTKEAFLIAHRVQAPVMTAGITPRPARPL